MIPEQSFSPSDPALSPAGPTPASSGPVVRLITVSAAYGAGGSVVAPALARRLGLPFLQRVTTSEGHPAEPGPCDEQLTEEEVKHTPIHRLLASFTQTMPAGPTQSPPSTHHQDQHLRGHGEAGIYRLLAGGGGVILGRGAAVVLGKDRGFHVRLDGPPNRRVTQGAAIEGIGEAQARLRLRAADKARTAYVRHLYRTDPADPSLYHLVIDSTVIPLDTVIELILAASQAHAAAAQAQAGASQAQAGASQAQAGASQAQADASQAQAAAAHAQAGASQAPSATGDGRSSATGTDGSSATGAGGS